MTAPLPPPTARRTDLAFAAALGLLPFLGYVRVPPTPGFWGDWAAVAVALVWLAVVGLPRRGWSAGALFLAVAALMLVHLAARLVPMPVEVFVTVVLLAAAAALAVRAADGVATEAIATGLGLGLIAALALNAVAIGFERLGFEWTLVALHPIETPPRAVGLIGQSNHLATLAVLAVAAAFCLRLAGRLPRAVLWAVTLVGALVLAATSSRTGMVVAAAALLVLGVGTRGRGDAPAPRVRTGEWLALLALFAAVQIAWIATPAAEVVGAAAGEGGAPLLIARSDAGRSSLWHDALALWRAHPLLGVGHGNFAQARLHDLTGPVQVLHADHAHNLVLQVASEWGSVGLVLLGAALVWLARAGWRSAFAPTPARLFALALVVALLVHSLAEHPLWSPRFLFAFALGVGLLVGWPWTQTQPQDAQPRGRAALAFGLVLTVAVCGLAAFDQLRLQRIAADVRADVRREPGTPARARLADAAAVEQLTFYPRPATLLLAAVLPVNAVAADAKRALARRAMDALPTPQTVARWTVFSVLSGQPDEPKALLLALRVRNPPIYEAARAILLRSTFGLAELEAFAAALPAA